MKSASLIIHVIMAGIGTKLTARIEITQNKVMLCKCEGISDFKS